MLYTSDIILHKKNWDHNDWKDFIELIDIESSNSKNRQLLAFMMVNASLQADSKELSKQFLSKALMVSELDSITRFVLASTQAQLGRASIIAGRRYGALLHFQRAYDLGGEYVQPVFYKFLTTEAELQLMEGDAKGAIQTWQDLASILQQNTPEAVYHRMSHCYSTNKKGFGGSPEENKTWGDCHKHELLDFFHTYLKPCLYFEIGVDEGLSLAKAKGKALGVDARPDLNLKIDLPDSTQILGISSDAFFRDHADSYFQTAPDLAFIDGMHLFEFALRDFINLERYAAPYALVGIDDIYPCHPIQAERRRRSGAWTGDVWKLLPVLEKYRPDLTLISLRCSTTGLLLISGLDKNNTQLQDNYQRILEEYQKDLAVPDEILQRTGSLPSDHPAVTLLLSALKRAKDAKADVKEVRSTLAPLLPFIQQAVEE